MKKILFILTVISLDQLIKYFFYLNPTNQGLFSSSCNPVLSWNIPLSGALFWLLWILAFGLLCLFSYKNHWNFFLLLVIAGALSNALDRLTYGCVVDYIKIANFPIFNLADVLISGGIGLFILRILAIKKPSKKLDN